MSPAAAPAAAAAPPPNARPDLMAPAPTAAAIATTAAVIATTAAVHDDGLPTAAREQPHNHHPHRLHDGENWRNEQLDRNGGLDPDLVASPPVDLSLHRFKSNASKDTVVLTQEEAEARVREESKVVKKIDRRLIPLVSLLYLCSYIDKVNFGNAKVVNIDSTGRGQMERDLGMSSSQTLWAVSIFHIADIIFEIPSNIALKRYSARHWITRIMISWGIVAVCTAFVRNYAEMMVCRFLLGVAEAGYFPGVLTYLATWYRPHELAFRIGMFYSVAAFGSAVSSILAYFFAQFQSPAAISSWRAIFFYEGVPSLVLSCLAFLLLPDSPATAKFFTPLERDIGIKRLVRDGVESLDAPMDRTQIWSTLIDIKVWGACLVYVGVMVPTFGFSFFLPTIISLLGYTGLDANLLASIPRLAACVSIILLSFSSDKHRDRSVHMIVIATIGAASFLILAFYPSSSPHSQVVLFAMTIFANVGTHSVVPIAASWLINNTRGQTAVAVATAMMVACGSIGGIVGPQVYQPSQIPSGYRLGHLVNAFLLLMSIVVMILLRWAYASANRNVSAAGREDTVFVSAPISADGIETVRELPAPRRGPHRLYEL
ncbi:major facilitator superfamily domain-containing protein [Zopfochytrium polystomum]|nr:major facilitator superfamily domain-containing protein [Zopfochytrium polystomum]